MKADREYKNMQSRIVQAINDKRKKTIMPQGTLGNTSATAQLFKVPDGLQQIKSDVTNIQNDIASIGNPTDYIPGSEKWALETRWAALRKLEEWNLVKSLSIPYWRWRDGYFPIASFGENNVTEADGYMKYNNGEYAEIGESKLVTGEFKQVSININNALYQLCKSTRASGYLRGNLVARIVIEKDSPAAQYILGLFPKNIEKKYKSWTKTLYEYYKTKEQQKAQITLNLIIILGDVIIFKEKYP